MHILTQDGYVVDMRRRNGVQNLEHWEFGVITR